MNWAWEGQGSTFPSPHALHEQQRLMETQRHLQDLWLVLQRCPGFAPGRISPKIDPNLAPKGAGAILSWAFEGTQVISHLGVRTGPEEGKKIPDFHPKAGRSRYLGPCWD